MMKSLHQIYLYGLDKTIIQDLNFTNILHYTSDLILHFGLNNMNRVSDLSNRKHLLTFKENNVINSTNIGNNRIPPFNSPKSIKC